MVWTILDTANMFPWHNFFLSENILIKHYSVVGTAESRILLRRFPNFLRQCRIHELSNQGRLLISKYRYGGWCNSRIYIMHPQNVENKEILVCSSMQILAASRIRLTQQKLLHLELLRPSRIEGQFKRWIFFC